VDDLTVAEDQRLRPLGPLPVARRPAERDGSGVGRGGEAVELVGAVTEAAASLDP
jgi:hypothetical protein